MDKNTVPKQQSPAPNGAGKPHPLTALALLEIGLFEVGFVIMGSLILFAIVNYFNILPMSEVFPKYLGWLPRREGKLASPGTVRNLASQGLSLQTKNNSFLPSPTPTLEKTARKLLYSFTSDNLNISITPSMSDAVLKQDNIEANTFTASWANQTGTSSATFAVSQDKNISYLYINNTYSVDSKTTVSVKLAEEIVPMFFSAKLQGEWGCKPIYENIYCENFWEENGIKKKGVSVSGPFTLLNKQTAVTVSMCEFNKASPLYSRKSCTTEFAKGGVLQ